MSTYLFSRSGSNLESATPRNRLDYGDLVTFLGVAQRLSIDFLPITWQPALDPIGRGATAEIREASANLQYSFVFKRPLPDCEFKDFEQRLFSCLIAEISTLGLESIRNHPNIISLEGICWEVISCKGEHISRETLYNSGKGGIIPVLAFEKAKYGDLYHFMIQEAGKNLSFVQKIGICIDVAKAIAQMHLHDIVHGDIKPQNILIFDNEAGGYIARVADFGYSTQWALPNDLIQMPRSRPWEAPEWHHRGFTPAQASKMDSYSFGIVVLWLLGYAALKDPYSTFEKDLRIASEATDLARPLAELIFEAHKLDLNQFFNATLTHNESNRCSDFNYLQELLTAEKITRRDQVFRKADGSRFIRTKSGNYRQVFKDRINLETAEFQVIPSMYQLYPADYRVRIHVANALLRKIASLERSQNENPMLQNLSLQCAVCYEIGFGVVRDHGKSQEMLSGCDEGDRMNFVRELGLLKGTGEFESVKGSTPYHWSSPRRHSTNYRRMFSAETGNGVPKYSLSLTYLRQGNAKDVELQYRKEIIDLENSLGASHRFIFDLEEELRDLLTQCGRQSEAKDITTQMRGRIIRLSQYDTCRDFGTRANLDAILSLSKQAGRAREAEELCRTALASASSYLHISSAATVGALSALSTIVGDQGRWEEAEGLSAQAIQINTEVRGRTHPDNLSLAKDLAYIFAKQEKWEEAETLLTRSIETSMKILGEEHPISINNTAQLVWVWSKQQQQRPPYRRQWTKIEAQQVEVMKKHTKVFGRDHTNTIIYKNNLAVVWSEQRLWRIAKTLFSHVVNASKEVFGKEHPQTLDHMSNMACVYQEEMIRKKSLAAIIGRRQTCDGILHQEILELSSKILGWDDPLTLERAGWLVWILIDQRNFKEAEKLQARVLETRVRLQGEKDPHALKSMRILAVIVRKQGRLREAIKLMKKAQECKSLFAILWSRLRLSLNLYS